MGFVLRLGGGPSRRGPARPRLYRPTEGGRSPAGFPEIWLEPGAFRARIYVPPSLAQDASLVVVLHGCTIGPSKPVDQQTASRAQTEAFSNGPL